MTEAVARVERLVDRAGLMLAGDERPGLGAEVYLCGQLGGSMRPTLRGRDLLEVAPYGDAPVRAGDVVLFTRPGGQSLVAHRVDAIGQLGIQTRGDSNRAVDPWLLRPDQLVGRVTAAWRGNRRVPVARASGLLAARLHFWARRMIPARLRRPLARCMRAFS